MYQVIERNGIMTAVLRLEDNANIPLSEDNLDYRKYLLWIAAGNAPEVAPLPIAPEINIMEQAVILLLKLSSPIDPTDMATKNDLLNKLSTK